MCLAQGPQRSDAGEARTRYPSVLSQALYPWATALPIYYFMYLPLFVGGSVLVFVLVWITLCPF